ncbi:hypothetical protein [uncultured Roseobacter sp.]|uniref:hypothetical protein n=1 Tax=uncultured Roseobacter sp. TaxID=114847 RepID=UPI0026157A06|nr:hypothetical protein [uncultured Roseobacter sp.]
MILTFAFALIAAVAEPAISLSNPPIAHVANPAIIQVQSASDPSVVRLNAVSTVIVLDGQTILIDPVGDQAQYRQFRSPDIVVLTRAAPEYLSTETMIGLLRRDTVVLAPQTVIDQLPLMISNNTFAPFEPGISQTVGGIAFEALDSNRKNPSGTQVVERSRGDFQVLIRGSNATLSL